MRKLILVLFITLSYQIGAQTELDKDTLYNRTTRLSPIGEIESGNNLQIEVGHVNTVKDYNADYSPLRKEIVVLYPNLPPIEFYKGPLIDDNPLLSRYPFVSDYLFYSGRPLSDRAWLSTVSSQNTYPTMGAIRTVQGKLNYQVANWLVVSGGAYGAKYNMFGKHYNDIGTNGAIKFILTDRIRFNGYGQYSVFAKQNGIPNTMGMYPQTYYGGTVELKITQKFGVEGGIIRELNPMNGKWENRPYIAPVFYSK